MSKSIEHNGQHFKRTNGYVYIARGYKGNIKVGGTGNVKTRMAQHRRKDHTIKLVAVIKSERYMYLEKFIHATLSDFKIANEWYKNEKEVIRKVVDFLKGHGEIFGAYEIMFTAPVTQ